jgi:hypothetical protein
VSDKALVVYADTPQRAAYPPEQRPGDTVFADPHVNVQVLRSADAHLLVGLHGTEYDRSFWNAQDTRAPAEYDHL